MADHKFAIEVLEEQLALYKDILNYFEKERDSLEKEGFGLENASYKHWLDNKIKIFLKITNLEYTIKHLKENSKKK